MAQVQIQVQDRETGSVLPVAKVIAQDLHQGGESLIYTTDDAGSVEIPITRKCVIFSIDGLLLRLHAAAVGVRVLAGGIYSRELHDPSGAWNTDWRSDSE